MTSQLQPFKFRPLFLLKITLQRKIKLQSRNSWLQLQLATKSGAKLGMRNALLAAEHFFPDSAHEFRQFKGT